MLIHFRLTHILDFRSDDRCSLAYIDLIVPFICRRQVQHVLAEHCRVDTDSHPYPRMYSASITNERQPGERAYIRFPSCLGQKWPVGTNGG